MRHDFLAVVHSSSGIFAIQKKYDIFLDKIGDTITQHLMMTKYFRLLRVFILLALY